jgi:phosphate transport system substrate-binding protein
MVKGIFVLAAALALSVSIATADEIKLSGGSTSITTVINPIKAAFEKASGHTINGVAAGSKVALLKLDAGDIEVATAAHTPEELFGVIEKENLQLKNRDNLKVVKLAEATFYAIIVHPANPVNELTKEQLHDIFTGKIGNWKELGGKDAPVLCVISNLSPGTNGLFSSTYMDGKKISAEALDASTAADLLQNVASNPEAIGFLVASLADSSVKKVAAPPMKSKPIILLTVGAPSAKVQSLIDFILAEGPKYIK